MKFQILLFSMFFSLFLLEMLVWAAPKDWSGQMSFIPKADTNWEAPNKIPDACRCSKFL